MRRRLADAVAPGGTLLLVDHDPPVLASTIGQRVAFADSARSGRLGEVPGLA